LMNFFFCERTNCIKWEYRVNGEW